MPGYVLTRLRIGGVTLFLVFTFLLGDIFTSLAVVIRGLTFLLIGRLTNLFIFALILRNLLAFFLIHSLTVFLGSLSTLLAVGRLTTFFWNLFTMLIVNCLAAFLRNF